MHSCVIVLVILVTLCDRFEQHKMSDDSDYDGAVGGARPKYQQPKADPDSAYSEKQQLKKQIRELEEQMEAMRTVTKRSRRRRHSSITASESDDDVATSKQNYIMKEKKIPMFKGKPAKDGDPEVYEWLDDVKHYLKSRKMTKAQKIEFIFDHLQGRAKSEIRLRPEKDRNDPHKLLQIILDVFGGQEAVTSLQEAFFKRTQQPNETVYDYSLSLMLLMEKIERRNPTSGMRLDRDEMLKGKLTEGVLDQNLKRELRRLNIDTPDVDFYEFRDRAIKWLHGDDCKTAAVNENVVEMKKMQSNDNTLVKLLENQENQQKQLETMSKTLVQLTKRNNSQANRENSPPEFQDESSERCCYICGSKEHIQRYCPENPKRHRPSYNRKCYTCGSRRHIQRYCPRNNNRSESASHKPDENRCLSTQQTQSGEKQQDLNQ